MNLESNLPKVNCVVRKLGSRRGYTSPDGAQVHEVTADWKCGYHATCGALKKALGVTRAPRDATSVQTALVTRTVAYILGPHASAADQTISRRSPAPAG